ncbi:hypothetical protein C4J81_04400 [Deltaproteobacteria bacterium Smac51]|nr:hypothetical protein C4J81_04400 [Deltaproteobacteria bacterium Smac51]
MAPDQWDDMDIAKASEALDAELNKIFQQVDVVLTRNGPTSEDDFPEAEILPDDDDPPEAEILPDDDELAPGEAAPALKAAGDTPASVGAMKPEEMAALIENAVERGLMAALKKLGKI